MGNRNGEWATHQSNGEYIGGVVFFGFLLFILPVLVLAVTHYLVITALIVRRPWPAQVRVLSVTLSLLLGTVFIVPLAMVADVAGATNISETVARVLPAVVAAAFSALYGVLAVLHADRTSSPGTA